MCEKAKNKKQTKKTKNKNKTNQNQTNKANKTKPNQPTNKQSNKSVRYRRVRTKQWRRGSQKYFPQPFAQSPPSRLPSAEAASDGQRPLSEPLDSAPYPGNWKSNLGTLKVWVLQMDVGCGRRGAIHGPYDQRQDAGFCQGEKYRAVALLEAASAAIDAALPTQSLQFQSSQQASAAGVVWSHVSHQKLATH